MNDLITIDFTNDTPTVSARSLHEYLDVNTRYNDWFPRMVEYGFKPGSDFNLLKIERVQNEGGRLVSRIVDDAAMTIDMAKEICMIQRNEKGRQARQYFIQVEKEWNSPEKVMARALKIANDTIAALESRVEEDRPKVLFASAVETAKTSILVGELAKVLRQNGVEIGQNRLFKWLRDKGYLIRRSGTDFNMPTQRSMDLGLFEIKETAITRGDGTVHVSKTPKVTGKGQVYFCNAFLNKGD